MKENPLVFVVSGKDPTSASGGYAAYSYNLCKILTQLKYEVHIIASGKIKKTLKTNIGILHIIPNKLGQNLPFITHVQMAALPIYSFSFIKEVEKIALKKKSKKNIIWGIGPWSLSGMILKANKNLNVYLISSYFTTFVNEWYGSYKTIKIEDYGIFTKIKYFLVYFLFGKIFTLIEKRIVNSSDIIITHYKSTEDILKKELLADESKFKRITYYTEVFKRRTNNVMPANLVKILNKHPMLITICRQDPRKGINYLLRAYKILKDKKIAFNALIVGSGDMLNKNIRLAKKLKILDFVTFLGFVNDAAIIMQNADIFVFSPVQEGSGSLSVLEAMSFGLPIVVTKCDGITEDLVDSESALLVEKENSEDLASSIEKLIKAPDLANKVGQGAKRTYGQKFGIVKMKEDVSEIMNNI